jgi:AcrR family transcriptional regulator
MRADAQRSRKKLLAAATSVFLDKGADAPLEEIARQAGVGIGTLYRHFPTRLDLQEAVFRNQVDEVCGQAEQLLDWPSPGEAFTIWVRSLTNYFATKRGLTEALVAGDESRAKVISGCSAIIRTTADGLLTRAKDSGEIRQDLDLSELMLLLHGVIVASERAPEKSDRLMSLLLEGIRGLQGGRPVLVGGGQHHGGAGGDPAERADLLQQVLERRRRGDPDLEDVVLVPRDAVAGLDLPQRFQPRRHIVWRRGVEGLDRDEGGQR